MNTEKPVQMDLKKLDAVKINALRGQLATILARGDGGRIVQPIEAAKEAPDHSSHISDGWF